jgi:hypothetical protein
MVKVVVERQALMLLAVMVAVAALAAQQAVRAVLMDVEIR